MAQRWIGQDGRIEDVFDFHFGLGASAANRGRIQEAARLRQKMKSTEKREMGREGGRAMASGIVF